MTTRLKERESSDTVRIVKRLPQGLARAIRNQTPTTRRAFEQAIETLKQELDVYELARAFARGEQWTDVLDDLPRYLRPLANFIEAILLQSGEGEIHLFAQEANIDIDWDVFAEDAVEFAKEHSSRLIKAITEQQRKAVRAIVANGVRGGEPPIDVARAVRDVVGLDPRLATAVQNYRASLVAQGRDPKDVAARASAYARRLVAYRSRTIARTETLWANNMGRSRVWVAARDTGLLTTEAVRRWSTSRDERTCPICAPMNGALAPLDGYWTLPNGKQVQIPNESHPNCRCSPILWVPNTPAFAWAAQAIEAGPRTARAKKGMAA